jgi:hypothetical protein
MLLTPLHVTWLKIRVLQLLQPHQTALDSMNVIHVHVIIAALQPLLDKGNDESNDPTGLTTCHLKYGNRNFHVCTSHLSWLSIFSHSGSIITLANVFLASDQLTSLISRTSISHQGSVTSNPSRDPHPGTWEAIPKAEWALHRQTSSIQIDPRFAGTQRHWLSRFQIRAGALLNWELLTSVYGILRCDYGTTMSHPLLHPSQVLWTGVILISHRFYIFLR